MKLYVVTSKATGAEVYRYQHDHAVEWAGMEFATHDHAEQIAEVLPGQPAVEQVWTKLAFQRRLDPAERIAVRELAKTDPLVADFTELLAIADEVRSTDPDVITALAYLTAQGVLAVGRAAEILGAQ